MDNRARNILSSILSGIGAVFLVSPFALYWFIHGSYERYVWIINGPFPFSNFGSGPFQMGMYSELFFIGVLLLTAAFGIWKQKNVASVIAFAGIAIIVALGATSLSSFMYLYSVKDITPAPTLDNGKNIAGDSAEFTSKIQGFVVRNIGQPIEGFSAFGYLEAFHGLTEADFNRVETGEGKYIYSNGKLTFTRKQTKHISSAEEAITKKGHETLLNNLRARLGRDLSVGEIISRISLGQDSVSGVRGTILLEPTCPAVKDPPEEGCADKPVFGTFVVKDTAGIKEFARFGTDTNGKFLVRLPPGEYSIESETLLGPGTQAHLVEVKLGEISEYEITFDTGIR